MYFSNLNMDVTKQFYRDGYGQVREVSDTPVILHSSDANAINVAVDHHEYQMFDPALLAKSPAEHLQLVCSKSETYNGADKWTFVGEWTSAMT
jgi:glucan 1,3-beta-glucosidase